MLKRRLFSSAAITDRFSAICYNDNDADSGGGSPPPGDPPNSGAGGSSGSSGAAGTGDNPETPPAPNQDWRTALAGDKSEYLDVLKAYDTPDQLFSRLNVDWRKQMAGDDPDAIKFLEKYQDPSAAYKAWRSAVTKLSEGGRVKVPGEGASPEEIAEWNKTFGLAEAPDKYEITAKPDAKIEKLIDDGDKQILGEVTQRIHEMMSKGVTKASDLVNFAHQIYYDMTLKNTEQAIERGVQLAQQAEIENRKLWGDAEYDRMMDYAIEGAKQIFPGSEEEFYRFMGLRLETGHAVFDHPVFQRIFAQVGMKTIEDPMFLALQSGNDGFDPQKRLDEIRAMRNGTSAQRAEYAKLSAPGGEMSRLLEALERRKGRAA